MDACVSIEFGEKVFELFEVDAHLKDELAQRHLLGGGELIEEAAVGAGVLDRLDGGDAQETDCLLLGQLRRESTDLLPILLLLPYLEVVIKLLKDGLQLVWA